MRNQFLVYRSFGVPVEQLCLESARLPGRGPGQLRVAMSLAPVNPSDPIPVTGAYAHRITLPAIAGYEGVGVVTEAPPTHRALPGRRVLPLRGPGTWQRQFADLRPALKRHDLPAPRIFPLSDWRAAIGAGSVPGAQKSILRFG